MSKSSYLFVTAGIFLCAIVVLAAAFLSSENPDGLESTAESVMGADGKQSQDGTYYGGAPFNDYAVPSLGDSAPSSAVSMIIGVLVIFFAAWALLFMVVRKNGRKEKNE
jgi:cobalt/nickel transport protein